MAFLKVNINEDALALPRFERNGKEGDAAYVFDINPGLLHKQLDVAFLMVFGPHSQFQ